MPHGKLASFKFDFKFKRQAAKMHANLQTQKRARAIKTWRVKFDVSIKFGAA